MAKQTIDLSDLAPPKGATKVKKRIGRGLGSGNGGTAGKGNKGQQARSGAKSRAWFEGGQLPIQRRLPKRGFTSPNKTIYQVVNLAKLADRIATETPVTPQEMVNSGLIRNTKDLIKVLGDGEWSSKSTVTADAFSTAARQKIEAAGGQAEVRA